MIEEKDGLPMTGPSARKLGVRPMTFPDFDVYAITDNDLVLPGQGGMSVAPQDPLVLPRFRRPASLGGKGLDPVWAFDLNHLGGKLQYRPNSPTHGLIEPAVSMSLLEFQNALADSRKHWTLYCR